MWGSWSLGTKHGQYTLGTLYSALANPQSFGSAKQIGLTDGARRALVALEFPYSEGGETLLCTKYEEKYYIRNWYMYADRGNILAISGKARTDKRKGEYRSRKLGKM